MTKQEIDKIINNIKREFLVFAENGKRTFLFVYCASHGVADQQQYMILNSTSGNLFKIEQTCLDVCNSTKNMCTVFAVYDMCKDELRRYPGLSLKQAKPAQKAIGVDARG